MELDLEEQPRTPQYDCLLFDLDDTLYPLSSGIAIECLKNIQDYMVECLGIDKSKLDSLCNLLYKNYGTTLAGLRGIGYDFDHSHYYSFVHGRLPYDQIKPDPALRSMMLSLPYHKVIFTNGDETHATKVLNRLGLEDCFDRIICFETLNPNQRAAISDNNNNNNGETDGVRASKIFDIISHFSEGNSALGLPKTPVACKPSQDAIEAALRIANIDPQRTIFFDDSVRNIQSAKSVGLHTVLIGTSNKCKGADYALESINNLREALPELWEANIKSGTGSGPRLPFKLPSSELDVV